MGRVQVTLVVLYLISAVKCGVGNAVAFFPNEAMNQMPFIHPLQQFHPINRNAMAPGFIFASEPMMPQGPIITNEHMIPQERLDSQELVQPILHTGAAKPLSPPHMPERPLAGLNYTEAPRMVEEENFRAAKGSFDYPAHSSGSYPPTSSYGYSQPASSYTPPAPTSSYSPPAPTSSYTPPSPASHYTPPAPVPAAPSYSHPAAHHPAPNKFSLLKPDFSGLVKPATGKVASKVSGLIGLVLSLLSGGSDDIEMKGFSEIVINGIIKPLLVAKGGIKSLISKLTIPVISLLLINLEVLVTVWWLWEECPDTKPTYDYGKPSYTPSSPSYNSYR